MGRRVLTLTGHPSRPNPFGQRVTTAPFNFDNPRELARSLRGATTLYNTYWIRFPRGKLTFEQAVHNSQVLVQAAQEAGVQRLVHISIANPSEDSPLPYYRGKAQVEKAIVQSGLSYAILRPTVVFGPEDILINNIAWLIRRFPVFAVPGRGDYDLQPIFVEDLADLAVKLGAERENTILDAAGPETFTFDQMAHLMARTLGRRVWIVHVPPGLALLLSRLVGYLVRDVVLTGDEVRGLMADLLVSGEPPRGRTPLSRWLEANAHRVGVKYASELARHYR